MITEGRNNLCMYTYEYNRYDDNIQSLPWSLIIGVVYEDIVCTSHWLLYGWSVIMILITIIDHDHDWLTCGG